ncbi:MAG TPA: hypothetical protein VMF30_16895 [Pirellulales bacterium]|nr:hypothetical protein [Pirellulales bacterium]
MSGGAHVGSFDAVRDFRAAVATFADEARDALAIYDMELRRTLDWLLVDQPGFWKQEIIKSEEAVRVARIELARCKGRKLPGGGEPSCMEEKKVLERARRRLAFAEDKLAVTRTWGQKFGRDATQYTSQASQLGDMFDADLPRALALLDRVMQSLEAYIGLQSDRSSAPAEPAPTRGAATAGIEAAGQADGETAPPQAKPDDAAPPGELAADSTAEAAPKQGTTS